MNIVFKEAEVRDGIIARFHEVCPGALNVYMVLMAYCPERTKVAKVSIKSIVEKTGFSLTKVIRVLNKLKDTDFIEAPFEGQQGKPQIYRLKTL